MNILKDSVVTVDSNTFIVDTDEGETVLLTHPLASGVLIRRQKSVVDTTSATVKTSMERGIDFANGNRQYLDYNTASDLEALAIYFTLKRKLTPRQKQTLAQVCGVIASVKFNDDLKAAMAFVVQNSTILDDFNLMWYNNFKGLFSGQQMVTSKKQRDSIFNIAGYALAELENPTTSRSR